MDMNRQLAEVNASLAPFTHDDSGAGQDLEAYLMSDGLSDPAAGDFSLPAVGIAAQVSNTDHNIQPARMSRNAGVEDTDAAFNFDPYGAGADEANSGDVGDSSDFRAS
jgi:hypothetical protein